MPYDRFVKLQIAADAYAKDSADPKSDVAALGLFGLGAQYYKNSDAAKAAADELDDRVDVLTRGFLGLTVSCARCHDHKFDPIATADYYGLAGIFKSTRTMEHFKKVAKWYENPLTTATSTAAKAAFDEQVATKRAAIQAVVDRANEQLRATPPGDRSC